MVGVRKGSPSLLVGPRGIGWHQPDNGPVDLRTIDRHFCHFDVGWYCFSCSLENTIQVQVGSWLMSS